MAQNVTLYGASYSDVPGVNLPKTGGGTAYFADPSGVTATPADVAQGKTFLDALGQLQNGTASGGGGGPTPTKRKDVNFLDYDGTILYSYTAAEAAALTELPANPSHTGLTAQGWNYTLAQIKAEVTAHGKCNVGQMYVTDDGKTRLYIRIPETAHGAQLTFHVRYTQTVTRGVEVNWGDGSSAETFTGTSAANRAHTYASPGDYVITLDVKSGTVAFVGTSSYAIYGGSSYNRTRIVKAEFGKNVTSIGAYAFYYCYTLQSVTIPSSVTSIGDHAFYYCYTLQSITIPSGVTSIAASAFSSCYALRSVTIPSSVTSIGTYTFNNCYALQSVTIPSSVTSVAAYAFAYCYVLQSITIPSSVTSIGDHAFYYCYALQSVTIPSSVTSIGDHAFNSCYALQSVTIPSGVTSIGAYTFYCCYALQSITIPSSVTSIGDRAFYYCYTLQSVTIPNSVTSIGAYAFYYCYTLQSVTIPSSVTSIGAYAFNSCYTFGEIHFQSTTPPTVANSNAFNGVPTNCVIYVPHSADHSILAAYQSATNYPSSATYTYLEESV